jgi:hypothetical protein
MVVYTQTKHYSTIIKINCYIQKSITLRNIEDRSAVVTGGGGSGQFDEQKHTLRCAYVQKLPNMTLAGVWLHYNIDIYRRI